MGLTKSEKKVQVTAYLKKLRKELREMHAGVTEEQTMPDPGAVKTVMGQLESLLELLDPKAAKKYLAI